MIKYREIWMGIAMLWIMLFHSDLAFNNRILFFGKSIGYGGADIFLFASGIGNYYSYIKDKEPLSFLKRRLLRLAPIYVPFIIIWGLIKMITKELSPIFFIGNLFGVQNFSKAGTSFNWYIAALIVCYLLTPFLASYINKNDLKKGVLLVVILILLSSAFWTDRKFVIIATRIPIYTIGMIFSKYEDYIFKTLDIVIGSILFFIGIVTLGIFSKYYPDYSWNYGLSWYPFILIAPFMCFLISYIVSVTERIKVFKTLWDKGIRTVGKHSFECYLVHIFLFSSLPQMWNIFKIMLPMNNLVWILAFILAFLLAAILYVFSLPTGKFLNKIFSGAKEQIN